ncbi:MAG: tyrosine-type recombinase/integrase [Halobacteria archaeon]
MEGDIYDLEAQFRSTYRRLRKGLDPPNRAHLEAFARACTREGLNPKTTLKYLYSLLKIARWARKDLARCTRADVERVVEAIQMGEGNPHTRHAHRVALKKFYRWIRKTEDCPEEVRWIRVQERIENQKLPEELLTEEEVLQMLDHCGSLRDKALVSFLWESGARIGEVLSLQIKHVSFESGGARVLLPRGKTGARRIKVVGAAPHLVLWIQNHPLRRDPEAPLWVGVGNVGRDQLLGYAAARAVIQRVARVAGVRKRVHPHLFRHSRATFLAKHMTESEMKVYLGWAPGSDQAATYVHLSGRDTDGAIDRMNGIRSYEEKPAVTLRPRACPKCQLPNPPEFRFCGRCATPLTEGDTLLHRLRSLLQNEETREAVAKTLADLVANGSRVAE